MAERLDGAKAHLDFAKRFEPSDVTLKHLEWLIARVEELTIERNGWADRCQKAEELNKVYERAHVQLDRAQSKD